MRVIDYKFDWNGSDSRIVILGEPRTPCGVSVVVFDRVSESDMELCAMDELMNIEAIHMSEYDCIKLYDVDVFTHTESTYLSGMYEIFTKE